MSNLTKQEEYKLARSMQEIFRTAVQACMEGNVSKLQDTVKSFIEGHPDSSPRDVIVGFHSEGKTLLHVACSSGKIDVVNALLAYCCGDDNQELKTIANLRDDRGFTPLINATVSESTALMNRLIEVGAVVNDRNNEGASALHFAAGDGSVPRIQLLLEKGADLSFQSQSGTPLHWAAAKGHALAIDLLLRRGAEPNGVNRDGVSAVLMAAAAGSDRGVACLVDAGADVGAIMAGNLTVLHICAEHGMAQAVTKLLQTETGRRCAAIATDEGNLPLHLAAMSGHRDLLPLLLEASPESATEELPAELRGNTEATVEWLLRDGQTRLSRWNAQHAAKEEAKQKKAQQDAASQSETAAAAASAESVELFEAIDCTRPDEAAAEAHKDRGNALFKAGKFQEALDEYTCAVEKHKFNASYWSNRSACFLALQQHRSALLDAEICRRLRPDWPKGCYRLAAARLALNMFEDAALAAFEGYKIDPSNKELKEMVDKAVKAGQEEHRRKNQQSLR
eukprot:gene5383-3833_t